MPRINDIYSYPAGTEGFPDTTIESEKYNNYILDVTDDLNRPRPISAGGTGANDADEALANLGAEKSSQKVLNYESHVFMPGSFYSLAGTTGEPVAQHNFVGIAVSSDPPATPPTNKNVVIRAYDQSSTVVPGRIYVRERKPDATHLNGLWGPWSIDGTGVAGPVAPVDPPDGLLWWDSEGGHLYVWYNDGNSKQWVIASPFSDPAQFLLKAGDTMAGPLTLQTAPPTADLHAATKKYVDDAVGITAKNTFVELAGDTMTGSLSVNAYGITVSPTTTSNAALTLIKNGGAQSSLISGGTAGPYRSRWAIELGTGAAETGGNVGSDFGISRYNDAGVWIGTALSINRQTAQVTASNSIRAIEDVIVDRNAFITGVCYYGTSAYLISDANATSFATNGVGCYFSYAKATGHFQWVVNNSQMARLEYPGGDLVLLGHGWQPGGGSWNSYSDIRIKTVTDEYKAGLEEVSKLRPVTYTYRGNDTTEPPAQVTASADDPKAKEPVGVPYPNSPHFGAAKNQTVFQGLVAQEVESIFPEMVKKTNGYIDGTVVTDLRSMDTTPLIFALINSIKELKARIETLEAAT